MRQKNLYEAPETEVLELTIEETVLVSSNNGSIIPMTEEEDPINFDY